MGSGGYSFKDQGGGFLPRMDQEQDLRVSIAPGIGRLGILALSLSCSVVGMAAGMATQAAS